MKRFIAQAIVLIVFGACLALILNAGRKLSAPESATVSPSAAVTTASAPANAGPGASGGETFREHLEEPLTRLFIQFILIIVAARVCGVIATKLGQPAVIGEMIAGILLGPSLLGWLWPGCFQFVFPDSSLGTLRLFSQIGVCLFMFVVGMDLDVGHLKQRVGTAVLVSQSSILFPYLLGAVSALFLYSTLAGNHTTFPAFALFVGISMSITAFPVLARILDERGLTRTPLGATALACAAANDAAAWGILAAVVAIAKAAGLTSAVLSIGLAVLFGFGMLYWVKPRLPQLIGSAAREGGNPGNSVTAGVLVFLLASALATDVMGIHALFGSFLAGVAMPDRGEFRDHLKVRLENFSSIFLLPLFFAFTGLRTQVGLLNDTNGWLICLALVLVATLGKLGGTLFAARVAGVEWLDSFALGALMNTRGLVELIALSIGYDLGILSARMFTMLVIMALATTCMTGPLLNITEYFRARKIVVSRAAQRAN